MNGILLYAFHATEVFSVVIELCFTLMGGIWKEDASMIAKSASTNIAVNSIISWIFGVALLAIGVLNVFLVHPIPGIFYLLLSFVYFPPTHVILKERFGFSIPLAVKLILGFATIWFTLGVSDLAELFGL